ncbi:MAG: energy-coupling factor transporter ATPase [Bacilli bacterium]
MSIKIENLYYTYNPNTIFEQSALKDINLTFEQGSFSAIVGHTGSGKSSLIQHLNGILRPQQGLVQVNDFELRPITKQNKKQRLNKLREQVGLVFQFSEYQLFEDTIIKDVMFGPKNFNVANDQAKALAHEALELVGIKPELYETSPFDLSGGQKRRVAIAGILAINPDIIVLDEPTAGLDPKGALEIMDLFKRLNQEFGKSIILVSHDMDIVYEYATQVILMNQGQVITSDNPISFFTNPKIQEYSIELPTILEVYKILFQDVPAHKVNMDELIEQIKKEYPNVK